MFFFENCAFYETVWKSILEPQMTMWRMRITFWIPKAANIGLEYVMIIAFPLKKSLHVSVCTLLYTYNACIILSVWRYKQRE
jgi:hypothetical protein